MNESISVFDDPQTCGDAIAQMKQTTPVCFHFVPEQLFDSKQWVIAVYLRTVSKSDVPTQPQDTPYMKFSHFA